MVIIDAAGGNPKARVSAGRVSSAVGCSFFPSLDSVQGLMDFFSEALHCLSLWEDTKVCLESLPLCLEQSLSVLDFDIIGVCFVT